MTWFLVLALIVGVVMGLRFAWHRFADRVGSQFERITTVAAVTPYCARLERVEEAEWDDERTVEAQTERLQAEGFELLGDFLTKPEGACLRVLSHAEHGVYAILQQLFSQPVAVELLTPYADGHFVSFTDRQLARWPDPPTHPVSCCPGARPKELLARLLRERPEGERQATPPERFAATYVRARQQAMAWMLERGGPTDAEIRAYLKEFPLEAAMEMVVSATRHQWRSALSAALQDRLRERFMAQAGETDARGQPWGERLVAVHDRLSADELTNLVDEAKEALETDDEDWDAEDLDEEDAAYEAALKRSQKLLGRNTPRQVFAQLNGELDQEIQLQKIGVVEIQLRKQGEPDQLLVADMYLRLREPCSLEALRP